MEIISDVSRAQWIVDRAGSWATVGGVAGRGFEAYARILHPVDAFREDLDVTLEWGQHPTIEKTTWSWAMIAERTGRVMHPLVQSRRLTNDESIDRFADGWRIGQIQEGWFDPALLAQFTRHLITTTPDDVVVGIWNGWGLPEQAEPYASAVRGEPDDADQQRWKAEHERREAEALASVSSAYRRAVTGGAALAYPGRDFVLLQSSLTELSDPRWGYGAGIGWTQDRPEPSPQLVWPADHAWLVASEIDWDSTIVAGSRSIVDAVLADPVFEAFEVGESDDLTWGGDTINPDLTHGHS